MLLTILLALSIPSRSVACEIPTPKDRLDLAFDRTFAVAISVPIEANRQDFEGLDSEVKKWVGADVVIDYDYGSGASALGPAAAERCSLQVNGRAVTVTKWRDDAGAGHINAYWQNFSSMDHLSVSFSAASMTTLEALAWQSIASVSPINEPDQLTVVSIDTSAPRTAVLRNKAGVDFTVANGECFFSHYGCVTAIEDHAVALEQTIRSSGKWKTLHWTLTLESRE